VTVPDACGSADVHCITCGDEGIAMHVMTPGAETAICRDDDAIMHDVAVDLVGAVSAGDELLVHAGVAIRHLGAAA
jgi:hydrogenase maturation factor